MTSTFNDMKLFLLTLSLFGLSFNAFPAILSTNSLGIRNEDEQFQSALEYMPNGNNNDMTDCLSAINVLLKLAANGNNEAKQYLEKLYTKGYDYWGDYDFYPNFDLGLLSGSSLNSVLSASINRCYFATLILGYHNTASKNYSNAFKYFSSCVKNLAQMNSDCLSIDKINYSKEMAQLEAVSALANCFEHGIGVKKDLEKSETLYLSIGGNYFFPEMQYSIPGEYEQLYVVTEIIDGFIPDPFCLRVWAKTGIILLKNHKFKEANIYYNNYEERISNGPSMAGAINLLWIAERYYKGLGVPRDINKAIKYFQMIIKEDCGPGSTPTYIYFPTIYADACYRMFEYYSGGAKDMEKANYYFNTALKYGSSSAIYDELLRRNWRNSNT